jgi:hypothetical protein
LFQGFNPRILAGISFFGAEGIRFRLFVCKKLLIYRKINFSAEFGRAEFCIL